jgi:hypothetical protein
MIVQLNCIGYAVNRKRAQRLMQQMGLTGVPGAVPIPEILTILCEKNPLNEDATTGGGLDS